jgi:membrane protein implicated in regulation of membrane protease activity
VADATVEGGTNLYTFRNFVNFVLGFGWSAILLQDKIHSIPLLLVVSVVIGVGLVTAVMYLFKWLSSMQQSGNINLYKAAVGCTGSVYIPIPGERGGEGKVQISINQSVREYNALTDGTPLKTGTQVRVVEVLSPETVLVEPLESLII